MLRSPTMPSKRPQKAGKATTKPVISFDTFSKLTPVFSQSRVNGAKLFLPPYQPRVEKMLRWMKRF